MLKLKAHLGECGTFNKKGTDAETWLAMYCVLSKTKYASVKTLLTQLKATAYDVSEATDEAIEPLLSQLERSLLFVEQTEHIHRQFDVSSMKEGSPLVTWINDSKEFFSASRAGQVAHHEQFAKQCACMFALSIKKADM